MNTHMSMYRTAVIALLAFTTFAPRAASQSAPPARGFELAAISPDGKRVAWIGPPNDDAGAASGLYVRDLENSAASPVRINRGELASTAVSEAAWSADSRMLAFLCAVTPGQSQVCVASADGQSMRNGDHAGAEELAALKTRRAAEAELWHGQEVQ